MSRDYRLYLQDILECCDRVVEYVGESSYADFSSDAKTIDAVVRKLEIIGEVVKNIPVDILLIRPDIDWKEIARFRDIVVHRYFRTDLDVVWDIVQNGVGELRDAVLEIVSSLPNPKD